MIFFVLFLIGLSILKRKQISIGLEIFLLINMIASYLNLNTFSVFNQLRTIAEIYIQTHQLFIDRSFILSTFVSLLALSMIIFMLYLISIDNQSFIENLSILVFGYLSRMLISLSPTLYASGIRTFTPIMLAVFIVSLNIIDKEIKRRTL